MITALTLKRIKHGYDWTLKDPDRISSTVKEATEWAKNAILAIRQCPDAPDGTVNPYRTATDEDIAKRILDHVKERMGT